MGHTKQSSALLTCSYIGYEKLIFSLMYRKWTLLWIFFSNSSFFLLWARTKKNSFWYIIFQWYNIR